MLGVLFGCLLVAVFIFTQIICVAVLVRHYIEGNDYDDVGSFWITLIISVIIDLVSVCGLYKFY